MALLELQTAEFRRCEKLLSLIEATNRLPLEAIQVCRQAAWGRGCQEEGGSMGI